MIAGLPAYMHGADHDAGPTRLYLHYDGRCMRAMVARTSRTGVLLCVPAKGIPMESFAAAESDHFSGVLGPFTEVEIYASGVSGGRTKRSLSTVLFDLDLSGLDLVSRDLPDGFAEQDVVTFGSNRGVLDWPHKGHLNELAANFLQSGEDRLDTYLSAQSEAGLGEDGGNLVQSMLQKLLVQSEKTQEHLGALDARMVALEFERSTAAAAAAGGVQAAAPAPQLFEPPKTTMTAEKKARLQSLAGRGPKVKDLGASAKLAAAPKALIPDGIIEGDEVVDEEDQEAEGLETGTTLEKILASQTLLLSKLAASKAALSDPLAMLTSGSSGEAEESVRHTGVKGIAARQILADSFRKNPEKVYKIFKDRLALARRKSSASSLESRDLWLHMQETVPLGTLRTLTYVGFQAAAMFESIEQGDLERLKMLVCLQAIFVEQAAYDGGSLRVAHLLTCMEDPPFHQTEGHKVAQGGLPTRAIERPEMVGSSTGLPSRCGGDHRQDGEVRSTRPKQLRCRSRRDRSCPKGETKVEAEKKEESSGARGGRVKLPSSDPSASNAMPSGVGISADKSAHLPEYISSKVFGIDLFKSIFSSRTPLGNFIRQSHVLQMMESDSRSSTDLWPCPIPDSISAPASLLSGRRRSRLKLRSVVREHLRVFVSSCNWLCLGRPKKVAAEGWTRQPLSVCQRSMLERLELSLRSWYRQSPGPCSDLQRSEQKFSTLHESIAELSSACRVLRSSFDPYSRACDRTDFSNEADKFEKSGKPVSCKPKTSTHKLENV